MDESAQLKGYERQFRRAGLPLFVAGFSASTDVFNRAAPLLAIVFLGELLGAGQLDWSWWQNVLAILGGVAFMLVAIAVLNLATGHPPRALPERIGKPELLEISIAGEQFQLTVELLRVAGGLAAFSGFYFAVAMLTDSTYREELTDEMRTSFEARAEYLRLRRRVGLAAERAAT